MLTMIKAIFVLCSGLALIIFVSVENVMSKNLGSSTTQFNESSALILLVRIRTINDFGTLAEVDLLESFKGEAKIGQYELELDPKPWTHGELKIHPSELLILFVSEINQQQIRLSHPRGIARFVENFFENKD